MSDELPKPNIVTLFEHYGVRVIGADRGGWRKAECPVPDHDDRNPSASINEDACRWRCHVCDKGGDAIDLIMEVENVGFNAALARAKEFAGEGDGEVSAGRGNSSLLPGGSRNRAKGSVRPAPWMRL